MPPLTTGSDMLDITPDTAVIHYMRRQNLTWPVVLKELIDNAIEASATQIQIEFRTRRMHIRDNGDGCPDLQSMITLGRHMSQPNTQIGQYGIGLKDSAVWSARYLSIRSVCAGLLREVRVDWDEILQGRRWAIAPILASPVTEAAGTQIEFIDLHHNPRDKHRIIEELGQAYMPALGQGLNLSLKWRGETTFTPIPAFTLPQLDAMQTEQFDVEGKAVQVTMGLVPPDIQIPSRGLFYIYGSRVVSDRRRLGFPPEAVAELFGWVEFSRAWKVEKNKRDILDDLTELEQAIGQRFQGLIAQALRQRTTRPLDETAMLLNERLKRIPYKGKWRKARRPGPHVKEGTVTPTGTGGKHQRADETQPGSTFVDRQFLSVQFAHLGIEADVCQLHDDVVLINEDAPVIVQYMSERTTLHIHAAWLIATTICNKTEQPQLVLPFLEEYAPSVRIYETVNFLLGLPITAATSTTAAAD